MPTEADRLRGAGPRFAHLHVHTEYSVLDGMAKIPNYIEVAKEDGQLFLGVTDHGVVTPWPEFYKLCRKADIEPVLGEEFYWLDDVNYKPRRGSDEAKQERAHFTVLAKGEAGFRVLSELSTLAHRNFAANKTGKPCLDRAALEAVGADMRHLVVFSGCAASAISRAILGGHMDEAVERTLWWREVAPNWYFEMMHHDTQFDLELNAGLYALAQRYSVPWVITNDPHYVRPEDHQHHDALLAIQTASDVDDPDRFRFDGTGYHLRSRKEMRRVFRRHYGEDIWKPGARETIRIARACKVRIPAWESRIWQFPTYAGSADEDHRILRRMAKAGLERLGLADEPEYVARLKFELKVMKEVGIAALLLITAWAIQKAKEGGKHPELGPIHVGPGRGSICGSLVAYCLRLHLMDPLYYNLRFDRFLNPARPKMPDIDTDFAQSRRDEMYECTRDQFGEDNVVHVAAYSHMKTKRAFQSLAKAHGIDWKERVRISKAMNDEEESAYALPEEITTGYPELVEQLHALAGTKAGYSNHAAGIVIAAPETRIRELMPEMWIASSKRFVGQYDLTAVEDLGLLKQDYLGLRTIDTIWEAVRIIKDTTGEELDPDSWWPDREEGDKKVYRMLAKGRTGGVFQMEGPTNTLGIQAIQPTCFEDIVSCTSLYRTGAISAGFPAIFLRNRENGQESIPYVHPSLEPILGSTWGVVLYQEQVMDMAEQIAGFSGELIADIVEAIKHKKGPLMQSLKPKFLDGCVEHTGMTRKVAIKLWKMIEGYSGYGYNRSHAVAYTFITYQTARLKALWPREYMTALLRTVDVGSPEGKLKRDSYRREALTYGCRIKPPCINRSEVHTTLEADHRTLRLGLADLSGIGPPTALKAILGRSGGRYGSVEAVAEAVRNKGTMEKLQKGGALKTFGVDFDRKERETMLDWQFRDPMRKYRSDYDEVVVLPQGGGDDESDCVLVGQIYKITAAVTQGGKPYRTWKIRWSPTEAFDVRLWSGTESFWALKEGDIVMVTGKWEGRWQNISIGNPRQLRVIKRQKVS